MVLNKDSLLQLDEAEPLDMQNNGKLRFSHAE